jgi:hypothetical protein
MPTRNSAFGGVAQKTLARSKSRSQVFTRAPQAKEEIAMRCKLALSALAVAALFGATAIASAQMQPAASGSSDGTAGKVGTSPNMKPGTTTGSATRTHTIKGVVPNPSFQDSRDAGTGRGK